MNKIILTIGGVLVIIVITLMLMVTTFFKTPEVNKILNSTSPLYDTKYSNVKYPNEVLTPGQIQTNDLNLICYHYYDQLLVAVPNDVEKQVYQEYMIEGYSPGDYEVDHFYPIALGGSNNLPNLWPQPVTTPGYKEKDWLQLYLRDQVCNHNMPLDDARKIIIGDWFSYYKTVHK